MTRRRLALIAAATVAATLGAVLMWSAGPGEAPVARPEPSMPTPFFTRLEHSYTFSSAALPSAWKVYDDSDATSQGGPGGGSVSVRNGRLVVEARGDGRSGACLCGDGAKPATAYGRWDVRARVTSDADVGAAILLWPNAENWPVGGEIDIFESWSPDRSASAFTVHYGSKNAIIRSISTADFTAFHTFTTEWTPAYVKLWIDGRLTSVVTKPDAIPHGAMHLAVQAGPNNGSAPVSHTASLIVQWVKTYGD